MYTVLAKPRDNFGFSFAQIKLLSLFYALQGKPKNYLKRLLLIELVKCETFTMSLILIISQTFSAAVNIVFSLHLSLMT